MTKKQMLRASIRHWEKDVLIPLLEKQKVHKETIAGKNCYYCTQSLNCIECPIGYTVCKPFCICTPYLSVYKNLCDDAQSYLYPNKATIEAVWLQIDFLCNVLYAEAWRQQ